VSREAGSTEQLARAYDAWHREHGGHDHGEEHVRFYNWALDLISPPPGARLLDVACGDGSFLSVAVARGVEASGIDLSPVAVESARAAVPGADLRVGDAQDLPYADSSFDVVTCLGSLEHLPSPDRGAAEIARVLRPSGTALVLVPNLFFLGHVWFGLRHGTQPSEGGQEFSETFRTSRGWTALLEESGLAVGRCEVWNRIHASRKVSRRTMRAWNALSRFVPRNGAYAFAFVCRKR
jgi:SAM-dependent methyltransferase